MGAMRPRPPPLSVGDVVAHFRVLSHLGSGGLGHIRRALDMQLCHEVVVRVCSFGVRDGRPYVVMELLRGESLRARMSHAPVPLDEALARVREMLRGLAAAHEAGAVRLDLRLR